MLKLLLAVAVAVGMVVIIAVLVRSFRDEQALAGRLGPSERDRVITRHARASVRAAETILERAALAEQRRRRHRRRRR